MITRIKLQGDRVLVRDVQVENYGVIHIPKQAREMATMGQVVAAGTGPRLEDGSRREMPVKDGDMILFNAFAGEPLKINDETFRLMPGEEILAVLEE
jgi:chaperonin GroES